jgi:hypothetical protein
MTESLEARRRSSDRGPGRYLDDGHVALATRIRGGPRPTASSSDDHVRASYGVHTCLALTSTLRTGLPDTPGQPTPATSSTNSLSKASS